MKYENLVADDTIVLQYNRYAEGVEKEKASFSQSHYNILPLRISDPTHTILEIPEVTSTFNIIPRLHKCHKY